MTDAPPPPPKKRKRRKGPGRPPRANEAATARIELRVTPAEKRTFERAAGDKTVSDWLRDLANAAAKAAGIA
jgi:hypothetical protein